MNYSQPTEQKTHEYTIATANTHEGRLLSEPEGLAHFGEMGVDVLLLQEVLDLSSQTIDDRLKDDGYGLAHFDAPSGLAIAVRDGSELQVQPGSERTEILRKPEKLGVAAKRLGLKLGNRLRSRGLIAIKLLTPSNETLTVASTHPIVFARALSRAKQVRAIGNVLKSDYYQGNPLIVAGDMNHYPGPRKVDLAMRQAANLQAVETGPTWKIRGSRHEKYAKVAAFITRRQLDRFDGKLDAILYRGMEQIGNTILEIESDHDAVVATFTIPESSASHDVAAKA